MVRASVVRARSPRRRGRWRWRSCLPSASPHDHELRRRSTFADDDDDPARRRRGGGRCSPPPSPSAAASPLVGVVPGGARRRERRRRPPPPPVGSLRRLHHDIEAAMPTLSSCSCCASEPGARRRRPSASSSLELAGVARPAFAAVDLSLHRGGRWLTPSDRSATTPARSAATWLGRSPTPIGTASRWRPALDRLAADARTARRRIGEAAARRLPVRLTASLVTCTLPSFVLLAIKPAVLGALSTLRGAPLSGIYRIGQRFLMSSLAGLPLVRHRLSEAIMRGAP